MTDVVIVLSAIGAVLAVMAGFIIVGALVGEVVEAALRLMVDD